MALLAMSRKPTIKVMRSCFVPTTKFRDVTLKESDMVPEPDLPALPEIHLGRPGPAYH
jgi:hypothetical protein